MREAVKIIKALADPTRLRLVSLLLRRDLCVCELMFILKMEQSRISHQLRILRDADLVHDRREGQWIIYSIPQSSRSGLEALFRKVLKIKVEDSREIREDLKNLSVCLKEDIRKRQSI
jgi:ArsR family transcriptional regulator